MNRREFINLLTDSLIGRVPADLVREKADYYRRYISDRAAELDVSEEEVIEEMGPPELIAHTIIDVYEAENGVYEGTPEAVYEESGSGSENENTGGRFFSMNMGRGGCLLAFFFVLLLFLAVGRWIVRLITAYPLIVAIAVLGVYLWIRYKRRD